MKAIIDGLRYDTDKATKIASWDNGAHHGDFHRVEETLYRTQANAYFIAGEGGALSCYASACEGGRASCGGEGIRPLDEAAAITWLENHKLVDELEREFPDSIQDA